MLTELEGAILSEIHLRGHHTAFQVRRAFAVSPSLEWNGSAGAVYPAVRRLEGRGLIKASVADGGRATRRLSLTGKGEEALMDWTCDTRRAASVGIDPFRLRSGLWAGLDVERRDRLFAALRTEILASLTLMESLLPDEDPIGRSGVELALEMQRARLRSLDQWSSGLADGPAHL